MTDLISLLPIIISVSTIRQLVSNRSEFWDEEVTLTDRQLAQRLALFVLVPLGVLLHEIGHSLATWQMGGTVETFRWYFFSGYIIPAGDFTIVQRWWISFAGNLVSILLGLLAIPLIFLVRKRIIAEILYFFACIQSLYALVLYPLYSAISQSGDWVFIYNPQFFPLVAPVAIAHLLLLLILWQLYRSQIAMAWRLARNPQDSDRWAELKLEWINRPNDLQPKLDLAYFLLDREETGAAKQIARKIRREYPNEPQIKVLEVAIAFRKQAYSSAVKLGKKLLEIDTLPLEDKLRLYRILSVSLLDLSRPKEALEYANRALAIAPDDYKLYCNRALLHEHMRQYQQAITDLDIALKFCLDEKMRSWIKEVQKRCQQKLGVF